jgi:hypothetical protein
VQRSWRVLDKVTHNDGGNLISYQIEGLSSGHDFTGPEFEPFSHNDLYVTTFKTCEKYPSHNPALNGCANDVSQFVNGESVDGADLVVWYGITFHHLPREEDEVYMDVHWDGFTIIPRDWTSHNPLDSVSGGGTAATATPSPTPTEPPPALEVKPQAVVLMAESLPQTVTLRLETTGDAPIPWQAQSGTAWLVASPLSGTAPTTLTLQVAAPPGTSSLLTGTVYTGTVTVSSKLTTAVQPALQVEVTVLRGMTETNYIPLIEAGGP